MKKTKKTRKTLSEVLRKLFPNGESLEGAVVDGKKVKSMDEWD